MVCEAWKKRRRKNIPLKLSVCVKCGEGGRDEEREVRKVREERGRG